MKKRLINVFLAVIVLATLAPKHALAHGGISSGCGVLIEQETGQVLFDKCGDSPMKIASITKILTAIIAIENGYLDDMVEIIRDDIYQVGSSLYMVEGDQMKLLDLIYGLMLRSGNDAAWAIARHIGNGDVEDFVRLMNEKAYQIGATNSTFQNPSGLDETTFNTSTAKDMALIQRYAMDNPIFREISSVASHRTTSHDGKIFYWNNKHRLVKGMYEPTISGKTGYTKAAGRTLVTSAARDGVELIAVTLSGADDWNDHMYLFEYGFNQFKRKMVTQAGELDFINQEIRDMIGFDRLFVRLSTNVFIRENDEVRTHLVLHDNIDYVCDVQSGHVGYLEILVNNQVINQVPVYTLTDVNLQADTLFGRVLQWLSGLSVFEWR